MYKRKIYSISFHIWHERLRYLDQMCLSRLSESKCFKYTTNIWHTWQLFKTIDKENWDIWQLYDKYMTNIWWFLDKYLIWWLLPKFWCVFQTIRFLGQIHMWQIHSKYMTTITKARLRFLEPRLLMCFSRLPEFLDKSMTK